jgi:HK97 gp10 family phage protein
MNIGTINAGKVLGNKELQAAMRRIPYAVKRNKFFMAVFRQASKPIIQSARAELSKYNEYSQTGQLRKSIKAFSTKASRKLPALYVGPKATGGSAKKNDQRGGGFYGAMLEYGTATSDPHPFMRPAWDKSQGSAGSILLEGSRAIVEKVLQRETKGLKRIYK